jgi:TPR repeat protein
MKIMLLRCFVFFTLIFGLAFSLIGVGHSNPRASDKVPLSTDAHAVIKKAELGNANAQFNLGLLYEFGKGVTKNNEKAVYWYRKAADQGYAEAQNAMGAFYVAGNVLKQDYKQAAYWFRKSAEQGNVEAQTKLGAMYFLGKGVTKDNSVAYFWGTIASVSGDKEALTIRDMAATRLNLAMRKDVEAQVKQWQSNRSPAQ